MGSETFENIGIGVDVHETFLRVSEEVAYEHGHGGYTGTIAEKGSYVVITQTPLAETEARVLADRLIQEGDQRIDDKWGPAGAIPVILDKRSVRVGPFDYTPSEPSMSMDRRAVDPNLLEVVKPLIKLKAGEEIQDVSIHVYETPNQRNGYSISRAPARRTKCQGVVTIAKPPLTREVEFEVTLPNLTVPGFNGTVNVDYEAVNKALLEAAGSNVRLKQGERVVGMRQIGSKAGKSKVAAKATEGKAETRYIIKGSTQHARWKDGLPTQAAARKWATDRAQTVDDGVVFEIEAVTRREGDLPLVVVKREVTTRTHKAVAIIAKDAKSTTPEGWLFFGWASS